MGITIEEKISILQNKIDNLNTHIYILQEDIAINPESDVEGKPTRASILNDFLLKNSVLHQEMKTLTNQG